MVIKMVTSFLFTIFWIGIPLGSLFLIREKLWMRNWNRKSVSYFIGFFLYYGLFISMAFYLRRFWVK